MQMQTQVQYDPDRRHYSHLDEVQSQLHLQLHLLMKLLAHRVRLPTRLFYGRLLCAPYFAADK